MCIGQVSQRHLWRILTCLWVVPQDKRQQYRHDSTINCFFDCKTITRTGSGSGSGSSLVCLFSHLWRERNEAVFRGVQTTITHSVKSFWQHGVRQLTALAKRHHRSSDIDTAVQGTILHACLDRFKMELRDHAIASDVRHDSSPSPVLLSWLRSFQTSCT